MKLGPFRTNMVCFTRDRFRHEFQQPKAPTAPPPAPPTPAAPRAKPRPPPQSPATIESDRTEKFSPIARVMNRTMTAALQIPHFGYKDEVDMSALVRLRKQLKHQVGQTINTTGAEKSLIP